MERLGLTILLCTLGLGSASVPIHFLPVTNFAICCSLRSWILNIFLPSCFPRVFLNLNRSKELNDFFYGDLKFRSDVLLSSVMKQDYFLLGTKKPVWCRVRMLWDRFHFRFHNLKCFKIPFDIWVYFDIL